MERPTGAHLIAYAATKMGQPYVWGALAPKDDPAYDGPWDCAEMVAHVIGVCVGMMAVGRYFGCGWPPANDSYSGFFYDDAKSLGTLISIEEAEKIPGAVLIRRKRPGKAGHVAFSGGNGWTLEAHSRNAGVCSRPIGGRVWDLACLPPGISFFPAKGVVP